MNIKNHIIKHFIKFKVVHSIPGRLRLKVNNASKIPQVCSTRIKNVRWNKRCRI